MYTEAFLFVGNLLQNGLIEEIRFDKNHFYVMFKEEEVFTPYEYSEHDVITLLKDIEELESKK